MWVLVPAMFFVIEQKCVVCLTKKIVNFFFRFWLNNFCFFPSHKLNTVSFPDHISNANISLFISVF